MQRNFVVSVYLEVALVAGIGVEEHRHKQNHEEGVVERHKEMAARTFYDMMSLHLDMITFVISHLRRILGLSIVWWSIWVDDLWLCCSTNWNLGEWIVHNGCWHWRWSLREICERV